MEKKDLSKKPSPQTHFGFEGVSSQEKTKRISKLFSDVAFRYNLMNDVMSFGMHRWWKQRLIHKIPLNDLSQKKDFSVIDMASGTGDIAKGLLPLLAPCPHFRLVLYDLTHNMLEKSFHHHNVYKICGDGLTTPFPSHTFDLYVMSFGLRNMGSIANALAEAKRILKPGGYFFCLEFSHISSPLLAGLYEAYSFGALPLLGKWISGNKNAYAYLAESIHRFPSATQINHLLEQEGFRHISHEKLSRGLVAIHQATTP